VSYVNDKLLDDIRRVGWHVLGIEGDATTPNVVHTVGLHQTFDRPEIVMVGLRMPILMQLVADIGNRVANGALLGPSVAFVHPDGRKVAGRIWISGGDTLQVLLLAVRLVGSPLRESSEVPNPCSNRRNIVGNHRERAPTEPSVIKKCLRSRPLTSVRDERTRFRFRYRKV
jgi:hypothetical protein